jgi:hypothetical protein
LIIYLLLSVTDYSKRGERLAKCTGFDGELAKKIKNCTAARYLSAKEGSLVLGSSPLLILYGRSSSEALTKV